LGSTKKQTLQKKGACEMKSKHNLNVFTAQEIEQAYEFQRTNTDWTFYKKREFVENLLQTRFNFLITAYTLFLVPFFEVKNKDAKFVLLCIGLIIVVFMGLTVYRVYVKLDVIMKILYKLGGCHVLLVQKKETDARKKHLFGVNPIIGYIVPIFLFLSIVVMGILLIVFDFGLQ
jgi:hypothetical protein